MDISKILHLQTSGEINMSCMQLTEDDLYLAKYFQNKHGIRP